jgi:anti-sigma B factor antagonist
VTRSPGTPREVSARHEVGQTQQVDAPAPPPTPHPGEPGDLQVSVSPGTPPVVAIRGEVDIQSAPELREELLQVIRRRGPQVTIDLAGVTFLDCAGINVLLATRRRAQLENGWVRLVRPPQQVRRALSLLNLEQAFGLSVSWPRARR